MAVTSGPKTSATLSPCVHVSSGRPSDGMATFRLCARCGRRLEGEATGMGLDIGSSATRSDGRPSVDGAEQSATLVEPNQRHESLASGLAREVTRVEAHGRLEGELRSIAV